MKKKIIYTLLLVIALFLIYAAYVISNPASPLDTVSYTEDEFGCIGYNMYMTPEDAARGLILMKHTPKENEDSGGSFDNRDLSKQTIFK